MNELEVIFLQKLRDVALAATPGPWRVGKTGGSVVCDAQYPRMVSGAEHHDYYGGGLVGESIEPRDQKFIAMMDPKTALALVGALLGSTESELSINEARVIRSWRVDLDCSSDRVAELALKTWGYGDGTKPCGDAYVYQSAVLLGEDPKAAPWA